MSMPEEIQLQDQFLQGKILGGKTYTEETCPPMWQNEVPSLYSRLHISASKLPFVDPERHEQFIKANAIDPAQLLGESFPLIEDFEVILWSQLLVRDNQQRQLDYEVLLFSPSRGFLAGFVLGDYTVQGLSRDDFKIPCGDFQMPYFELEQAWALIIAEKDEFVYVLAGSFEEVFHKKGYRVWFKVEKERYFQQWEKAIQLCRQR